MPPSPRKPWHRDELMVAMHLYCLLPFGRLSQQTPEIQELADKERESKERNSETGDWAVDELTKTCRSQVDAGDGHAIVDAICWAEEFGVVMFPLERGGFALLSSSALEGAPTILGRDFIRAETDAFKTRGSFDKPAIYAELGFEMAEDTE